MKGGTLRKEPTPSGGARLVPFVKRPSLALVHVAMSVAEV